MRGAGQRRGGGRGSEGGCKRVGCSCARAATPSQDTDAACTAFTPAGNAAWAGDVKGLAPLINLTWLNLETTKVEGAACYGTNALIQAAIRK